MQTKRYKPLCDGIYLGITLPTVFLTLGATVLLALAEASTLFVMIPLTLFILYFSVASLFGYVELRESTLFIKYGPVLKREIPYSKIRGVEKDKKFYSESMMSLKNALTHVNIKYNSFDVTTVSVIDNDGFVSELKERMAQSANGAA